VQKESKVDPKLLKAKFVYGMVLVGLALLQDDRLASKSSASDNGENGEAMDAEKLVDRTTRALAPVFLPMLESIGALEATEE
jgi:hypothetical protein